MIFIHGTKTILPKWSISPFAVFSSLVFLAFTIISATILSILIYLSVLPLKFLLPAVVIVCLLDIILGYFTYKKIPQKTPRIICIIVEIFLTIVFSFIFFYLNYPIDFFDTIRASEYQIEEYQVVVPSASPITTLEELENHTIATYDDTSKNYKQAFDELINKIELKNVYIENINDAIKSLQDSSVDSLFIKASLIEILAEIFPDFKTSNLRILDTIIIKTPIDAISTLDIDVTQKSFNIFVSGIDTEGDISTVSRSDANMVVTVNPRTHTILFTSIPRDYYVQLHGTHELKDKLTHAGLYGINVSVKTVEDLFNIKIDFYIRVNFDSTINLIDAIGGIEVTPDATFTTNARPYCYFEENATTHVDGACALAYARERRVYGTGDLHRIQNHQEVLTAIIDKLTSSKTILTEYTRILSSMVGSLETNIPSNQFYKLFNMQLDSMPNWKIERISVTGDDDLLPTYTFPNQNLFVFIPDSNSVLEASTKIHEVLEAN